MMPHPTCSSPRKVGQIEMVESEIRVACNSLIDSVNLLRERLSSVLLSVPHAAAIQEMVKETPMCAVANALSSDLALIRQAEGMIRTIIGDLEV